MEKGNMHMHISSNLHPQSTYLSIYQAIRPSVSFAFNFFLCYFFYICIDVYVPTHTHTYISYIYIYRYVYLYTQTYIERSLLPASRLNSLLIPHIGSVKTTVNVASLLSLISSTIHQIIDHGHVEVVVPRTCP